MSLAVFDASFEDGTWTVGERLTEPFDVEVTDDGAGFVDVETPALSGDRVGGRYFVGPSDMQPGDEGFGDSVWILSERAKLQELTKAPDTDYYDLTIMFGWPDHTYNLQSLINGEWVTWTQTGEGYPALVEDGSAEYELTPPDAPAGNYETRVLNVTTGEPGPVQASVEFGSGQVAPSPSVSSPEPSASVSSPSASSPEPSVSQPSPEPKASGEPGTSQVPTDAPEPSATDSDDVPSPSAESTVRVTATASATERTPKRNDPVGTRKKSTRPGLPRTGVS